MSATRELPVMPQPRLDMASPNVGEASTAAALLADPVRAAILALLASGPVCVCEMAAALGQRENNISNHLAKLRDAQLVRGSRHAANGRFLYYERDEAAVARARAALAEVLR
jgi:ArsR family transcriptional regulator